MSTVETPLFVKTHDFLLWLIRHTQRRNLILSGCLAFTVPRGGDKLRAC